jgi:ABC-type phosphate transport system substrate-binding protein
MVGVWRHWEWIKIHKQSSIRCASRRLLLGFLTVLVTAMPVHGAQSVEVIANPQTSSQTLSQAALRAIFAMRIKQWPDGAPVKVFVLPDRTSTHEAFCKEILRIYPYVLRDTWDRMVFTGAGQAPTQVNSPEELLQHVAKTPGGIGYIEKGKANEMVKTLQIR